MMWPAWASPGMRCMESSQTSWTTGSLWTSMWSWTVSCVPGLDCPGLQKALQQCAWHLLPSRKVLSVKGPVVIDAGKAL